MDQQAQHRIRRQVIELTIPDGRQAWRIQDRLSELQRHRLETAIAECLDGFDDTGNLYRFDRVVIELGVLDVDRLERDLLDKLGPALGEALRGAGSAEEPEGESSPGASPRVQEERPPRRPIAEELERPGAALRVPPIAPHVELLVHFLRTGDLPWWAEVGQDSLVDEALRALLGQASLIQTPELWRALATPEGLSRLVTHARDESLAALASEASPLADIGWSAVLETLGRGLDFPSFPRELRRELWSDVLRLAFSGADSSRALWRLLDGWRQKRDRASRALAEALLAVTGDGEGRPSPTLPGDRAEDPAASESSRDQHVEARQEHIPDPDSTEPLGHLSEGDDARCQAAISEIPRLDEARTDGPALPPSGSLATPGSGHRAALIQAKAAGLVTLGSGEPESQTGGDPVSRVSDQLREARLAAEAPVPEDSPPASLLSRALPFYEEPRLGERRGGAPTSGFRRSESGSTSGVAFSAKVPGLSAKAPGTPESPEPVLGPGDGGDPEVKRGPRRLAPAGMGSVAWEGSRAAKAAQGTDLEPARPAPSAALDEVEIAVSGESTSGGQGRIDHVRSRRRTAGFPRRLEPERRSPLSPREVGVSGWPGRRNRVAPSGARRRASSPGSIRSSSEDDYRVFSAGLVLLWPFLPTFFSRLGLLEDGSFRDPLAQQRAVGLLGYLAAEKAEIQEHIPPEYQLILPKVLCGLEPESYVDPGPPIASQESGQCAELLASVIANAPQLGDLSVAGLRGTFLLRPGVLQPGPECWLLRVERQSFDVVLDRLSWQVDWLKLPFMARPMQVAW